jgi:CHASE3 domain sensor protein
MPTQPQNDDRIKLRDLLEAEVKRLDEKIAIQNNAINEATRIATAAMDKRLDSMNEFRQTMNDWSGRYQTREEANLTTSATEKRLSGLEKIVWGGLGAVALIEIVLRYMGPR